MPCSHLSAYLACMKATAIRGKGMRTAPEARAQVGLQLVEGAIVDVLSRVEDSKQPWWVRDALGLDPDSDEWLARMLRRLSQRGDITHVGTGWYRA